MQHAWLRYRSGTAPERFRPGWKDGREYLLQQRQGIFPDGNRLAAKKAISLLYISI